MKFIAEINIMPLKALLDPQGKAVTHGLKNLGLNQADNVRVGKRITMEIDADSKDKANEVAETACKKLLANQIMESYDFTLVQA
jgi:phosphoribosylformylglycinamidine synthase PurS subunit